MHFLVIGIVSLIAVYQVVKHAAKKGVKEAIWELRKDNIIL